MSLENMSVRVTDGTLKTIKRFAHNNGVSIRVVLDEFAALINAGYIKIDGKHIKMDNPYSEFEKVAKDVGKDPIVVITSVTEQLRRK
jgi:hypothetical protein